MATSGGSVGYNLFGNFPKLVIGSENPSDDFKRWLKKYEVAIRVAVLSMGTEEVDEVAMPKFRGEKKLLALLTAVGTDGMDILESFGFDISSTDDDAHDTALEHLKGYYTKKESDHVAWVKAATMAQACGETELEFLLRVEKQSRCLGFREGANLEELREKFATSMALVGLRDGSVRNQLVVDEKLTWRSLSDTLKSRSMARDSNLIVSEAKSGNVNVGSSATTNKSASKSAEVSVNTSVNRLSSRSRNHSGSQERSSRGPYRSSRSDSRNRNYNSRDRNFSPRDSSYGSRDKSYRYDSRERNYRGNSRDRDSRYNSRDRHSSNGDSWNRYKSPGYRSRYERRSSGSDDVCYICHRPDHVAVKCPQIRCYACGKRGHIAKSSDCERGRSRRDSADSHRSPYRSPRGSQSPDWRRSPGRYSPGRSNNSSSSYENYSTVRFCSNRLHGSSNALKQRIEVDGKNTEFLLDTGADVSTVTEETSKALSLRLEISDRVLSGVDGLPLLVLGKARVFLESNLKSTKAEVYVLRGSKANLLGLPELRNLSLLPTVKAIGSNKFGPVVTYPQVFMGLDCKAKYDHFGNNRPGFFCHRCHVYGHWAKDCPDKLKCRFCGSIEHPLEKCPSGGAFSETSATKRQAAEVPAAGPSKRPSTVVSSRSAGGSYSSAVTGASAGVVPSTAGEAIGSFLDSFRNFDSQDFESQLTALDKEAEKERDRHQKEVRRHEERMAFLAARKKEVQRTQRNADKLQTLLAQLQAVKEDMQRDSDSEDPSGNLVEQAVVPTTSGETSSIQFGSVDYRLNPSGNHVTLAKESDMLTEVSNIRLQVVRGDASADPNGSGKASANPNGSGKASADPNGSGKASADPNGSGKAPADPNGSGKAPADSNGGGEASADPNGGGEVSADPSGGGEVSTDASGGGLVSADLNWAEEREEVDDEFSRLTNLAEADKSDGDVSDSSY